MNFSREVKVKSSKKNINIYYSSVFLSKTRADRLFELLENELEYNSDEESMIHMHGRMVKIPRRQVAYGDEGTFYRFSGKSVDAKYWDEENSILVYYFLYKSL